MNKLYVVLISVLLLLPLTGRACTTVIVSARANASGRPVMLKHRDTGTLDNKMTWIKGPKYYFIGLQNATDQPTAPTAKPYEEVWCGMNEKGFCIMNTASYNLKDDDVPVSLMDREGIVMRRALGICATVEEFQHMLDTLSRPMGVEANFGVIDAVGGAAYFEVNNHSYTRFDVADEPQGYMVVTNFCRTGRKDAYRGYERFLTAEKIMSEKYESQVLPLIDHRFLLDSLSRSKRTVVQGSETIPRKSTSASVVFEGVVPGTDPRMSVAWVALGNPLTAPAIPLVSWSQDMIPDYLKSTDGHAEMCDLCSSLKGKDVKDPISSTESVIDEDFNELHSKLESHRISFQRFRRLYGRHMSRYFDLYSSKIAYFIKNG